MLGIEENDVIPDSRGATPQSGFGDVGDDYDLAVDSVTGRGRSPAHGLKVQFALHRRIKVALRPAALPAVGNSNLLEFHVLNAGSTKSRRCPFGRMIVGCCPGQPRTETITQRLDLLH